MKKRFARILITIVFTLFGLLISKLFSFEIAIFVMLGGITAELICGNDKKGE